VGTLEAGKFADLAVLSQDIFSVPAQRVGKTRVLLTLVGGEVVYGEHRLARRLSVEPIGRDETRNDIVMTFA